MAEIATHPYTKWQKSRPIPIPELKNCDPSKRHLRTRHQGVLSYPGFELMGLLYYAKIVILFQSFAEMALNSKLWFSVPWFLENESDIID